MFFWGASVGLAAAVVGGFATRQLEKVGHGAMILLPVVGLGIGTAVRVAGGESPVFGPLGAVLAYLAAMLTHVPSAYRMLRIEFGATALRSALLSIIISVKYPVQASAGFPFYGLMLALSIAASVWRATS